MSHIKSKKEKTKPINTNDNRHSLNTNNLIEGVDFYNKYIRKQGQKVLTDEEYTALVRKEIAKNNG